MFSYKACLKWFLTVLVVEYIVKLHSDLRVLTQLELDGVGVDFVFARKEGRRRRRNPHLASTERNGPTDLKFGGCLEGVLSVSGGCLEDVWMVSGGCLDGV